MIGPVRYVFTKVVGHDFGRSVFVRHVGEQDPARHLLSWIASAGYDDAVIVEVAMVRLCVVSPTAVLRPELRFVQMQVTGAEEALREVDQIRMEGKTVQCPCGPRSVSKTGPWACAIVRVLGRVYKISLWMRKDLPQGRS